MQVERFFIEQGIPQPFQGQRAILIALGPEHGHHFSKHNQSLILIIRGFLGAHQHVSHGSNEERGVRISANHEAVAKQCRLSPPVRCVVAI